MKRIFTILMLVGAVQASFAQNFTKGNVVVARLGDGANTANTRRVSLVEFNPTKTNTPTINTPTNIITLPYDGTGSKLTINASATGSEGVMSVSQDGKYLVIAGGNVVENTNGTDFQAAYKSFARVNSLGTVEAFTITGAFYSGFIRSTTSVDGSELWFTATTGIGYVKWAATGTSRLSSTGSKTVLIKNNTLLGLSGTNPATILNFGIPASAANNGTSLAVTSGSGIIKNGFGFVFLDADKNTVNDETTKSDVLYIADQDSPYGIVKMVYKNAAWEFAGKYSSTLPVYGLTGRVNDEGLVELYAVRGALYDNELIKIVDNSTSIDVWDVAPTITQIATAGANYTFRSVAFSPYDSTLPLNLTSFKASSLGNNAILKWITNNETNVKEFVVEKSTDGINFNTVKAIPAKNEASNTYNLTDWNIESVANYYRIKVIDNDGSTTFSNIETVTTKGQLVLNIYPNPATDNISLSFPEVRKDALLQIFTLGGKKIKEINLKPSSTQLNVNVSDYSSGQYILTVTDGDKKYSSSFIK